MLPGQLAAAQPRARARARWRIHAPACAGTYMHRRALAHTCTGVRPPPQHFAVALDRSVAWRATQHNLSQRRATCCIESRAVTDSCGGTATPSAAAASSLPLVGLPKTRWPTPYSWAAIASDSCDRLQDAPASAPGPSPSPAHICPGTESIAAHVCTGAESIPAYISTGRTAQPAVTAAFGGIYLCATQA